MKMKIIIKTLVAIIVCINFSCQKPNLDEVKDLAGFSQIVPQQAAGTQLILYRILTEIFITQYKLELKHGWLKI